MKIYEGKISGKDKKIGIIVSRFNGFITERLLEGAKDCLIRHEVNDDDIDVYKVSGAFEIPQALNAIIKTKKYDAIICLSAIIRGETPHFDFLAKEVTRNIGYLARECNVPIGFGILTADDVQQAIERAGGKLGNKGFDTALSVLEQMSILSQIYENYKKKE